MIHAIEIGNFRSFGDTTRISFTYENPRKPDYRYVKRPCGVTVSRLAVFMGANASGKTGVLQAMKYLWWFISQSNFVKDTREIMPPNPFHGRRNEPSQLAVEFDLGETEIYRYELSFTAKFLVLSEKLLSRKNKTEWSTLFERNLKDGVSFFSDDTSDEWKRAPQKPEATLISSITQGSVAPGEKAPGRALAERIVGFVDRSFSNLTLDWDDWNQHDLLGGANRILESNEGLLKQISEIISDCDTGIQSMRIRLVSLPRPDGTSIDYPVLEFGHMIDGKEIFLGPAFNWESAGTLGMTYILSNTLPVVNENGIITLDEVERHLHPHVLPKLVRTLLPHNSTSQIFLVTHSDALLREIDRRQLHLVEKKESGRSVCYRADRIKGLKSDRNMLAWYHTGALGGIPRL